MGSADSSPHSGCAGIPQLGMTGCAAQVASVCAFVVHNPGQAMSLCYSVDSARGLRYHQARMQLHSIVVISLHTPKERIWGELLEMNSAGVTVRGIDLNSFDDFIRQVRDPEGDRVGLPTLFFPMQRVERIALDESRGSIPSLADTFERKVGRTLLDYLALFA